VTAPRLRLVRGSCTIEEQDALNRRVAKRARESLPSRPGD